MTVNFWVNFRNLENLRFGLAKAGISRLEGVPVSGRGEISVHKTHLSHRFRSRLFNIVIYYIIKVYFNFFRKSRAQVRNIIDGALETPQNRSPSANLTRESWNFTDG